MLVRASALSLLTLALCLAQDPGPLLTGRVVDALTGQGISGAEIRFISPKNPVAAVSGFDGRYELRPEKPGTTFVAISREGYAALVFPASGDDAEVQIRPRGETRHDFRLKPAAQVSGRLVDESSGAGIEGLTVQLLRDNYGNGYLPVAQVQSEADGEFFFKDVAPGVYVMEAGPAALKIVRETSARDIRYRRHYYGGAQRPEDATPLYLSPGQKRSVEFPITAAKPLSISGVLDLPSDEAATLLLSNEQFWSTIRIATGELTGSGPFRVDGLAPGRYHLSARTKSQLFADYDAVLTDHDLKEVKLTPGPGTEVSGVVRMGRNDEPFLQGVGLSLEPVGRSGGHNVSEFQESGQFAVKNVRLGEYFVGVTAPPGYAPTAVTFGGHSVMNSSVRIDGSLGAHLEIILEKDSALGSIAATVKGRDDEPIAGARLAVIPESLPSPTTRSTCLNVQRERMAGRRLINSLRVATG